ncbi:hypothetical protein BBK82_31820 [Lentzea guizhouensis]|uniref:Sugar-binding protein n=1 Tax=Lentzea guizhouensis TaxID=1586287 RepID=A0A1B2HQI0_9PSEU|nr:glycosyltransferase [Lentzea guizhouensis]ANZ39951.1 hypothetical protein BBK82_31820 [Lentzea guizhouensis]
MQKKGDEGKVDVPKELHFAWFGNTPSPDSVNGMLEWAQQVKDTNGDWKATLWTDGSSANWDPEVKQQLQDAGIEINSDVDSLVNDLSNDVAKRNEGTTDTTINQVYQAAQDPKANAYNLASDIARYAVLNKNGGVYVDVDVRPGGVSLKDIGDMKMHPTDVPVVGPRLRDTKSVQKALGDSDAQLTPDTVQAAADARWNEGELGNAFIVTPPNGALINKIADVIPQKYDSLAAMAGPDKLPAELKKQAPDVSGPNALADAQLPPTMGIIGQVAMEPKGLDLGFNPGYLPHDVPAVKKSDFGAMFDPDLKNTWSGLEWVTPESESQLDSDTKPSADNKPDTDKGGNDKSGNDKGNQDSRPAPRSDAPPAPPAPPAPQPKDNGPTVKSGGAPPARPPAAHKGSDILSDQGWRHDPAKTADWFAPKDPVDPRTWQDRREGAQVGKVDTEIRDIKTNSTLSNPDFYKGAVRYDVRRIETSPGNFVQEYTVKMHVDPGGNADPNVVEQVKQKTADGVNNLLNQGFRMPSGDQFHLNVEFTDNPKDAHASITVGDSKSNTDQDVFNPNDPAEIYAHETLHYLGVPDEYGDKTRVFNQHDTNSGVHKDDGGMMGADVRNPDTDPGLRPRHLWLIENFAHSQTPMHDTKLDAPPPSTTPAPQPSPDTTGNTDADTNTDSDTNRDTRSAPQTQDANLGDKRGRDEDSDTDEHTSKRPNTTDAQYTGPQPGSSTVDDSAMDVDSDTEVDQNPRYEADGNVDQDTQTDALVDQLNNMSITDVDVNAKYNEAFAKLGEGKIDLPTKDNYLAKLKENVENGNPPSFVVNMIVGHGGLGDIEAVIDSITKDAGDLKENMVFVVGVNGKSGDAQAMAAAIDNANAKISGRPEPIALVQLDPIPDTGKFPYGDMRNQTMNSAANKFAVGAMAGKGTHPYLSIQDFDTGSRQVPSGKDIFTHFTESMNPEEGGPIRPLTYSGGYRVGDPKQLVADVQTRIDNAREKAADLPQKKREAEIKKLDKAQAEIQKPDFPQRFEQAMKNDMDARARQGDTHPLLPYGPEPNLFIDAVVPIVDPNVKFSDGTAEFNGLSQSMNEFAANEIVEIHTNQLPPNVNPDADPDLVAHDVQQGIATDADTNRNAYRGETFSTDFVDGAVATDLSRLALGFAETGGKSWPQSHVNLTNVPNRFFGGDPAPDATPQEIAQADKAAKKDVSFATIREDFKGKDHNAREALTKKDVSYNKETGEFTVEGGWNPSKEDAKHLGWQDKNSLNTAISAPLPDGSGYAGIDPEKSPAADTDADTNTDTDAAMDVDTDAQNDVDPNAHIHPETKQHKTASALNIALSDNNSNVQRTFGQLQFEVLPDAGPPRPDGLFNAVHSELSKPEPVKGKGRSKVSAPPDSAVELRENTVKKGWTASPDITSQIAEFRQQHGIENGHLVNAFAEPGPTPAANVPDSYKGGGGNTEVDNTGTPGAELNPDQRAEQDAKDKAAKDADNAVAAKAEELAGRVLATELKRPIVVHNPDGSVKQQFDPFVDRPKPDAKPKAQKPGVPIHVTAEPNANGKTSYSPFTPANNAGPSASRRAPAAENTNSTNSSNDTDSKQSRPAPSRPAPSLPGSFPTDTDTNANTNADNGADNNADNVDRPLGTHLPNLDNVGLVESVLRSAAFQNAPVPNASPLVGRGDVQSTVDSIVADVQQNPQTYDFPGLNPNGLSNWVAGQLSPAALAKFHPDLEPNTPGISADAKVQQWRDAVANDLQNGSSKRWQVVNAGLDAKTTSKGDLDVVNHVTGQVTANGAVPTSADLVTKGLQTPAWNDSQVGKHLPAAIAQALDVQLVVDDNGVRTTHGPANAPQVQVSSQNGAFGALGGPTPQEVRAGMEAWLGGKSAAEVSKTVGDLYRGRQDEGLYLAAQKTQLIKRAAEHPAGPQGFVNDLMERSADLQTRIDAAKVKTTWKPEALQTKDQRAQEAARKQQIATLTDLRNSTDSQIQTVKAEGQRAGITHVLDSYVAGPNADGLEKLGPNVLTQLDAHLTQQIAAAERAGFDASELKALQERVQNEPVARRVLAQAALRGLDGLNTQLEDAKEALQNYRDGKAANTGLNGLFNRMFGPGVDTSVDFDQKIAEAEALVRQAEHQLSFANDPDYTNRFGKAADLHQKMLKLEQIRENIEQSTERRHAIEEQLREAQERREALQQQMNQDTAESDVDSMSAADPDADAQPEGPELTLRQEHAAFKASLYGKSAAELGDLAAQYAHNPDRSYEIDQMTRYQEIAQKPGGLQQHLRDLQNEIGATRQQVGDLKRVSDVLPDALKTELMRTDQAQREAEQQRLTQHQRQLDNELQQLQYDRTDALTTYALNLPADPDAPGWQSVSPQDVELIENHVTDLIRDARVGGVPTPELDRLFDTVRDIRISDSGPVPSNDPAPADSDGSSDSASVQSDPDVQEHAQEQAQTAAQDQPAPAAEPRPEPQPQPRPFMQDPSARPAHPDLDLVVPGGFGPVQEGTPRRSFEASLYGLDTPALRDLQQTYARDADRSAVIAAMTDVSRNAAPPAVYDQRTKIAKEGLAKAEAARTMWNASDLVPNSLKTQSMLDEQAARRESADRQVQYYRGRVHQLTANRTASLTAHALQLPADPNAPGWRQFGNADIAAVQIHVEQQVRDAQAGGHPTGHLTDFLDFTQQLREERAQQDTRPAPSAETDAPKIKSGGAPPPMTPPTAESHQGKDVITDESWRHDPARTADWFAPANPADPSTWADRRADAHVRTVDVVVHDVRTDSTPADIKSYQGLINYDLRRIETSPGNFVQEYTVKVHVDPAAGVTPDMVAQVKENAANGVNSVLNQGFRLPSGDQFHLNLEFTDNKADAHTSVKVDASVANPDQTHWGPDTSPEVLAHETLHYLGVPDEYSDSSRVFQQHDTNSGVHEDDGGLMGSDVHLPDPGVRPRHLWLVERTANSQVMVPDTTLEPAGPATVPPPAGWTPPGTGTTTTPVPEAAPNSDADSRPMPPRPTPNPVVPMTTLAPQPVGQVPGTNLPSFFQDNRALGSITPTGVRGADAVVNEIQGIKPDDAARIKAALETDFESFLGGGRNFQVKIGGSWFEANVRAEMQADTAKAATDTPDTKVDKNYQAAASTSTTNTIATSNDVGASVTAGTAMGPYGSLGGKAALATPAVSQATTNSITEQRAIKSGEGSKKLTVPVSFEITVTDASGNPKQFATLSTGPDVTLQIPADLSTIVDSGKSSAAVTPPDAQWGAKVENAVPEAVVVENSAKAFADVAAKLHPSITKVGSPGREALQNFLSPTSIRTNLPAMLGGFVTSPDLVSPHASKGAAVQMTATLKDAKLVGTHDSAALDLKDTSAWGSSVSASTKTGFDVTAGVGGNIGVPGQVGGTVGGTLTYSSRTAEGVNAGSSTSRKTGIGVKNETGLYEVTAEVEVRTPAGDSVKIPVTTHMRMGLHEAGAAGLPTPDGTRNTTTDPDTAGTKFLPPYVADTLAAGNAKVGEFTPAAKVQGQVEGALRNLPGFEKFLPQWNNPDANPRSSKGQGYADVAEQLANQRKLTANLSPAALRANMDSLLGPGVQVQLKNSGKTTNTYVNVTVKAKLTNPKHLGQADARPVSDSTTTGPKLDANTSTTKGWTGGVQGRVTIPVKTGVASLSPSPQVGASYSHSWTDKTTAGPAVSGTSSNPGSADAQVFQQDVEFEVEITSFTRPRAWVRNIVPGAPGFHSPEPKTVAKTGAGLEKIDGKVNLWVSDSSTLANDPGDGFKPGDPEPKQLKDSPTVKDLLNPKGARPKSPEFLNVEAVANTTALRDQAIDALNRAAGGDSALTVPGTAARAQIDKMFTPENVKANLQRLIETGVQEQGLKYDRRVTDRSGAIGMSVKLGDAKLVSISDTTGADNSVSGGYKAGESSSTSRSVDLTAGVNVPVRPNVTPPPAGQPTAPSGSGGAAVTGKITPWSDTKTESNEIGGNVDRGKTTPGDARTVLVQIDAEFTIVGESRAGNFVHGGTPHAAGVTVTMPKSVFVRVTEDVARELGALPTVAPNVPKPDFPELAPPAAVAAHEPGALGLSNVESVPDLSGVVSNLTTELSAKTKKFGSDSLIPDSVLKDSMSNLQRIVDLNSPTSVKAMIDSALDGGVPLLVHQPGTFGKDSYQVTLRAKAETPRFDTLVNDGVDMTHNVGGSRKESDGQGRGTGWGVGVRAPGLASPGSANPKVSGTAGVSVGANIGGSTSSSVTNSVSESFSHSRTASGPAARYTVPVEFELVVEKGSKVVAEAKSGTQEMVVRTHADNQKIAGGPAPQAYMSAASRRGSEFGTPDATFAFQQDSRATQLPPTASVENLRGAKDLREAAVKALTEAGAGKGLTGKGTGALNSLLSTLSPENLQPHLPSMLSGPLTVPGLHEAALTFGQDADVKVYAKLVNPRLDALSDGVKIDNPLTTRTSETSSEAKVSETADVSVGLAQGSAAIKQGAPGDTVNVGTGGVEARHAGEDSAAVSGGPAQAQGGNLKPAEASRSGLVQFDVEYRVVATIGGKTGVVDLTVPGSAGVRLPAVEAETLLRHEFGDSLKDAQTEVKTAADDWRTAEKEVESARHEAQDAINSSAAVLARTDQPLGAAATALNTAIEAHVNAQSQAQVLEMTYNGAVADVAATRSTIQELTPQISSLSLEALATKDALDDAQLAGAPQPELDRLAAEANAAHNALTAAQQQLSDAHTRLDVQRGAAVSARADVQAHQQVVADAAAARAVAEEAHRELADERAAAEQKIKDAETKLDEARRAADAKQQQWWDAKAKVDREVDAFNTAAAAQTPPAPPAPPAPPTAPQRCPPRRQRRPPRRQRRPPRRQRRPPAHGAARRAVTPVSARPESSAAGSSRAVPEPSADTHRSRPAPVAPPSAPADTSAAASPAATAPDTIAPDTTPADADVPPTDPQTVVNDQLAALTADAMATAPQAAQDVRNSLVSNPDTFLHADSGLKLLQASVVLDQRTDQVAALIDQHGLEAVAKAFNTEFGRPIIETQQFQDFPALDTDTRRAAFDNWAHGLWGTINGLGSDADTTASEFFNHDKGYNRATNFAQQAADQALLGNPELSQAVADRPYTGGDRSEWVYRVFSDAGLINGDGSDKASDFTALVDEHRDTLQGGLGRPITPDMTTELRASLVEMYLLDNDLEADTDATTAQPSTSTTTWTPPSAPPPTEQNTPAEASTADRDTGTTDVDDPDAHDPDADVTTEADTQLAALTADAMSTAPSLIRSVQASLENNPGKFVHAEAGLHLLRASTVLHTRTNAVAAMIEQHGLEAVTKAFNKAFERPVIETEQIESFDTGGRPAFDNWAMGLWGTIVHLPFHLQGADYLASEFFNHDKGFNRATNFVQKVAQKELFGGPDIADDVRDNPYAGTSTADQAAWVYQRLSTTGLIQGDGTDTASGFTAQVTENSAVLQQGLGVEVTPRLTAQLRQQLVDMMLLENDIPTPPSAPATEVDTQLAALTTDAMANATPLMREVEAALRDNPGRFVHAQAGTHLLHASVVLHTRGNEIAALVDQHGLEAVTKAFNQRFERPVIETEQIESFATGGRPAFTSWSQNLWATIENLPADKRTPDHVAAEFFNHDKGYNRATNFAQKEAEKAVLGSPELAQGVAEHPYTGSTTADQAAWVFQRLDEADVLRGDGTDTATEFTAKVEQHAAELNVDPRVIPGLRHELVEMFLLDNDMPNPSAPPQQQWTPGLPPADNPNPLHSTEASAPWFDPRQPVSSQDIADARATTPATSWVRGEDGGVMNTTTVGPDGIKMQAWRSPIAYDNRVMNVNGVDVRDFTVRLHLENGTPEVQERTRQGVEELYNQGYRLPSGEQFHVTVEFTDNPNDAHATVEVSAAGGRANQLVWPADTDPRRLAHEVGHFLGLRDEYFEPGAVKPIFQHQDGRGRVVGDDSPMTAGIDAADAHLKPRHLQLVEDRMKALASVTKPTTEHDQGGAQAPDMPPKRRRDAEPGSSSKRVRNDGHVYDDSQVPQLVEAMEDVAVAEQDVQMADPEPAQVTLDNAHGVQNAAFENLANGQTLTPITAANYLDRTRQGIEDGQPPSFVVSMIVRASDLGDLDNVINSVMNGAGDANVAFVLGVNAGTQAEIDAAMATAQATIDNRQEPIALASVVHGRSGFKYGETRNSTLNSNAHKFAVHALAANGTHPYVSVMDFDDSSRITRSGEHAFAHVRNLMAGDPEIREDVPQPSRPLLVGGGYRLTETQAKLKQDTINRIDNDTSLSQETRDAYVARVTDEFIAGVVHDIDADMRARRNQAAIHPLLPYTPEPNLFFDALVPLADPEVKFGDGGAEFGKLGKKLNEFYANEIAQLHDSHDPKQHAADVQRVKVDVQNNRHPVRGEGFVADFVDGDTGTDVSRMAYGKIKEGNISQSHTILSTVPDRLYLDKAAKKGTSPADVRAELNNPDAAYAFTEPLREPRGAETKNSGWQPGKPMDGNLGGLQRNKLNAAVSAPMPAPFTHAPSDQPPVRPAGKPEHPRPAAAAEAGAVVGGPAAPRAAARGPRAGGVGPRHRHVTAPAAPVAGRAQPADPAAHHRGRPVLGGRAGREHAGGGAAGPGHHQRGGEPGPDGGGGEPHRRPPDAPRPPLRRAGGEHQLAGAPGRGREQRRRQRPQPARPDDRDAAERERADPPAGPADGAARAVRRHGTARHPRAGSRPAEWSGDLPAALRML